MQALALESRAIKGRGRLAFMPWLPSDREKSQAQTLADALTLLPEKITTRTSQEPTAVTLPSDVQTLPAGRYRVRLLHPAFADVSSQPIEIELE